MNQKIYRITIKYFFKKKQNTKWKGAGAPF